MSVPTTPAPPAMPVVVPAPTAASPSFVAVCRSEWTKLRSVRSTYWTFIITVVLTLGIGMITTAAVSSHVKNHPTDVPDDPVFLTFVGLQFAQLAIGVLGVLVMSAEYTTGMIRTTFSAVPQRLKVLFAKATVFGVVTLVVSLVTCWLTFVVGASFLHDMVPGFSMGLGTHFGPDGPVAGRAVIGAALYLVVMGLLGVALGTLIRRTAGAIVALVGLVFVLPGVLIALREGVGGVFKTIYKFLPTSAGAQVFHMTHDKTELHSPWGGFVVLVVWMAVFLAAGAFALKARDV